VPSPGAFGRLRLPQRRVGAPTKSVSAGIHSDDPVVLFMPAHNEEDSIEGMVARVPPDVSGHRVVCLVIDDGSDDTTARRAEDAGAEVLSQSRNRGLGFAVRRGLREAVARNACAVTFCDADGEYAPEELDRMVGPILRGQADYVVGSRLRGSIKRMPAHRRLGNIVLTRMLGFIARRPISDGQSGYRAFSREAAADAEIVHDFNYAQVLTLDLLAKGYRYAEVPITYAFRESGKSFVRPGSYVRHVLPAIHTELNSDRVLG
jgi:glycosyltransferase involved in cell wall biosynthesis